MFLVPVFVMWPLTVEPVRNDGDTLTLQSVQFVYGDGTYEEPEEEITPESIDPDNPPSFETPTYSYGFGPLRLK